MALSFVGAGPLVTDTSGAAYTVGTTGLTLQANDLVVIVAADDGGGTFTGPSGWTAIDSFNNAGNWASASWWHLSTGSSDNAWTVTPPSGFFSKAQALVFRGNATTSPIDAHSHDDNGGGTSIATLAVNASAATDYLLVWYSEDGVNSAFSVAPTGLTGITNSPGNVGGVNVGLWIGYQALSASGNTTVYTATLTGGAGGTGYQTAIKAAASITDPFPLLYEFPTMIQRNAVYRR